VVRENGGGPVNRFDAEAHAYYIGESQVPSVTSILKDAGFMGHYNGTAKRDRGTAIHEATELYDALGILPDDDELVPFVKAWGKYLKETGAKILESEQQVYHEGLWYAGTLDRIVDFSPDASFPQRAVLDIKSGSKADWHGLQLAAYALAEGSVIDTGIVVYLKESGRYTTEVFLGADFLARKDEWIRIVKGEKK